MRTPPRTARRTLAAAAVLGATLLPAGFALAHPLAPALLDVQERADGVVDVRWKEPIAAAPGAPLHAVLPGECSAQDAPSVRKTSEDGGRVATWTIRCPGGLAGKHVGVTGLAEANTSALLRAVLVDGSRVERVLSAEEPFVTLPAHPSWMDVARDYFVLGLKHIATGADHLLFVLGLLLLVGATRSLALAVTGFTLGHSLTLSIAVLGHAPLPSAVVEVGIALSVFALAAELTRPAKTSSFMRRYPVAMACAFGLLHGFGFAGALREVGLPPSEISLALLSFNGGIEVGQLGALGLAIAAIALIRRASFTLPSWSARVPVYAMGSLAAFWSLERAALLFHSTPLFESK